MEKYYSNGKLLITGEYVVLDGAKSLAVPTKFGQSLQIKESKTKSITWKSFDNDNSIWFEDLFSFEEIIEKEKLSENSKLKNTLIDILHQAYLQNQDFLNSNGFDIETHLTFPRNWGLGTSSTLINNIAKWLKIDAFELLQKSFGGSGYDIACAQSDFPIVYRLNEGKPIFEKAFFNPNFAENIHFLYLNKKQSSKDAISNYISKQNNAFKLIPKIDSITQDSITCKTGKEFALLMEKHEVLMSELLESETIKEILFPDFKGVIKSLGAWGGDFVMVVSKENPKKYFEEHGFETLLKFHEILI